jgi:hypothetical protein
MTLDVNVLVAAFHAIEAGDLDIKVSDAGLPTIMGSPRSHSTGPMGSLSSVEVSTPGQPVAPRTLAA